MKTHLAITTAALTLAASFLSSAAHAQSFNQNIVAIFGAGNPDTGWTVDTDSGITLALRAKNRETGSTDNIGGVYEVPTGLQQPNNNRARWNWEFSIDSGAVNLSAFDYYVGIDTDPSAGISHTIVDALTHFGDNSYGNDQTLNGQGVEGPSTTYASVFNISQQSQNLVFSGQDPIAPANYDYELYAVEKGAGPLADKLSSVSITVVVGTGGATVQELIDAIALNATNHGDYVTKINELVKYLQGGGVINKDEKKAILTAATKSSVGK
jgi:hypothetical protein